MDAQSTGSRRHEVQPSLEDIKNELETSSENIEYDSESGSELRKRDKPDNEPRKLLQQQLILRKRDIKGNYKAKFNLEKLMIEHEKKKIQVDDLNERRQYLQEQLNDLRSSIGKKVQSGDQLDPTKGVSQSSKSHWDFLIKEMKWMSEDFERESKKKVGDSKKQARQCKKQLHEKKLKKEKELKDQKIELRRKAQNMSKMVQQFWKSIDKVVKHNYNILYEKKRAQIRTKKLENFVSKHLKLSVKVAEELNTKSFIEQSNYEKQQTLDQTRADEMKTVVKLYSSQDDFEHKKEIEKINDVNNGEPVELKPYKRQKITVTVIKSADGFYSVVEDQEKQALSQSQVVASQTGEDKQISRALIAEQTVEMAKSLQPTGFTLSSVNVKTKVPFLLQGELREYQIIGLDWLVTLHNKKLNGILADEMGLGKTIQTISMLASLACEKGIWGPHLIVVPTTIIINWEMEFKKWCPAFKILTYFGSQKERKIKRHGWSKENSFHVCITSYKLVIQDHFAFRRKKWYYMILDEAQNIKNFKSQRWQTLLRFNTKRRLLLTGTPLQNDVMELWSLMHFLMPNIFSSQQDFKEWFSNPFSQSINQNQTLNITVIQKLQSILRPFLLRRMKRDVEKQLPEKIEHIVQCNLSRRQRLLYDEYINNDRTRQTLQDSDFFSIINVLMQLRKVCNHPDLFEARTIESPFIIQERISLNFPSLIFKGLMNNPLKDVNLKSLNFLLSEFESISKTEYQRLQELYPRRPLIQVIGENKNHLDDLSSHISQTRPLLDGLAQGRALPVNCNVLAKSNTKQLAHTLPAVLPYESNIYHEIPSYLNIACLPFSQHYYSLNTFDQMRYSQRNKEYHEYDNYMHSLHNEEERLYLALFANKLIQWRDQDHTNRRNLIFRKPVYGEDCIKAVKTKLLFSNVLDVKKHKNLDKNTKNNSDSIFDLDKAPSSVFNSFALSNQKEPLRQNTIEDWPEESEEQIEQHNSYNPWIKEVPMSQQIKNKKKKKQLKEQIFLEQQQRLLQQQQMQAEQLKEVKIVTRYSETEISLIINMKGLNSDNADVEMTEVLDEMPNNPNVEVQIIEVIKEKIEVRSQQQNETEGNILNGDGIPFEEEQPYQRIYQNASKRFKKDEQDGLMQDVQGDEVQKANLETETHDLNSGQTANQPLTNPEQQQLKDQDQQMGESSEQQRILSAINQQERQNERLNQENGMAQQNYGGYNPSNFSNLDNNHQKISYRNCDILRDLIITPPQRVAMMEEEIKHFKFIIPKCVASSVQFVPSNTVTQWEKDKAYERFLYQKLMSHRSVNQSLKFSNILFFPHKNLIQYDCGKLQKLAMLLKNLHSKGHKVLIFTQMTRILDILENFLNLHGYTYVRLDGSVKVEQRQKMVDKFNLNKKIFCFISSTRCGGIGINLTGADCVIFYDTDWNPAMDKQAQDRCHRIGQTKQVHIYRLISVNTIEENIFKKSLQKRDFGGLIIEGNFDMEFFKKVSLKDILDDDTIFKPRRRDLMKEEHIIFHTNNANIGLGNNDEQEVVNEFDFDKQREIEMYRKRFEDALIRIEDKEDVIALQQAKREIDDEFDEDAILHEAGVSTTTKQTEVEPHQAEEEQKEVGQIDNKSANQLSKDLKKSEYIDWQNHTTLNEVTKSCIQQFEASYSFDQYLEDRSKKDTKFINPLKDEEEDKEEKSKEARENEGSEFSFSEEDEEMLSQGGDETFFERGIAENFYKRTKDEIEQKYFVI